ncbi:ubiquitin carboxyl-terminal hydrolase 25-like isoform X2 [Ostrea edulis]|uniref:ubiquitin carboxyl-terminal hydrolase 25-like isoform X2 n=1 Tax=Ostrea edulis TaxID=37623 RepID=UPI0024AEC376|nr:ubiquitin carboxyl-terminal hydrolase 25-like isoform X2 [Ostrea edulis]
MTVEQPALPQHKIHSQSKVVALSPRDDVTKNADTQTGQSTIDARGQQGCENKNSSIKQDVPYGPENKNHGVIDLTNDTGDQDDIQKAIAASLQESQGILGGQISREEQDISRVLEQSLAESKAGSKRKRGDIWFVDPLNPHERKRQEGCPVGLKNVGNTCWFSAVIQSLFHLRKFRHLVLNFKIPKELSQGNSTETRNLRFMQELRYLFALMVGSQKKYVDPSKAVEILKEAFSSSASTGVGDSQQDVSEFQHKLLEWLEDAFKSHPSRSPSPTPCGSNDMEEYREIKNPMCELFYGQYRAEGINEGKRFSNEENFGQFPLQVNGFRDIHESLEAATAQGEIETINRDATQKSGQELWFTRLPPVLTFELSRFQFNQQLGRPEKIHNKIEFPHVIYMDRYLDCNNHDTRQRREQVKKLMEELVVLYSKLDKFNHYGSGSKKVPLQDVLSYALEFAQSKPNSNSSQDVEMESPKASCSTVSETEKQECSSDMGADVLPCSMSTDITMTTIPSTPVKGYKEVDYICNPSPRHVSENELNVLQHCLHRWRTEVEQDVRELQEKINKLEITKNSMYSDEAMKKCPYHLHAVLVHEGQAASGHYWAYIYDSINKEWLKFNDIAVTSASWDDLVKESVGGYHNASAYCLMYVGQSHVESNSQTDMPPQSDIENLPDDLKEIVIDDNKRFAQEIVDWDEAQSRNTISPSGGSISSGGGDGDVKQERTSAKSLLSQTASTQTPIVVKSNLPVQHAEMMVEETLQQFCLVTKSETYANMEPETVLKLAIQSELKHMDQIFQTFCQKVPCEDPRLMYPVVYLKCCMAPARVIDRFLHEQFSYCPLEDDTSMIRAKEVKRAAIKRLELQLQVRDGDMLEKMTQTWHDKYNQFRKIAFFFVRGLQLFHNERYEDALLYLVHCYSLNSNLVDKNNENWGLQKKLVNFYRRQCLLHLNDIATSQFETQDDIRDCLKLMNDFVVPCLPLLLSSCYQDDVHAGEEMREKWCSFLGQEICDEKIEKLQDLMSKLFDPPSESKSAQIAAVTTKDLKELYRDYLDVMNIAFTSGYVERAANSN